VSAINAVGSSAPSMPVQATPSRAVPSSPTNVAAVSNNNGTIGVSWNAANGQGHGIPGYQVLITDTSAGSSSTGQTGGTPTVSVSGHNTQVTVSATNGGVQLGQSYTFQVIATNNLGKASLPSASSSAVTAQEPPGAVTGLAVTPDGTGQLSAAWTCDPVDPACSGGSNVTKFLVVLSPATISTVTVAASAGTSSYSTALAGLTNGTSYTVSVQACNALGCTPSSQAPSAAPATPFGAPGTPSASASVNGNSITWTWSVPSGNGSPIASYNVAVDGAQVSQANVTSYTGNYGCGQSHTLTVAAVNAGGDTGGTASSTATTAACPPPSPSVTISVGNATGSLTTSKGTWYSCSGCYWVDVSVANFPANASITFSCYDNSSSTQPFWTNPGSGGFAAWYSTNGSGDASWAPVTGSNGKADGCYDSGGYNVYVTVTAGGKSATSSKVYFP
jgi:hypothetical protein